MTDGARSRPPRGTGRARRRPARASPSRAARRGARPRRPRGSGLHRRARALGSISSPARRVEADSADDEEDEDLLEETPDFLQDAPEGEDLWFEQGAEGLRLRRRAGSSDLVGT